MQSKSTGTADLLAKRSEYAKLNSNASRTDTDINLSKSALRKHLLESVPWLRNYGKRLINALLRAGVRNADDIGVLHIGTFAQLRGVGSREVEQLRALQRHLSHHQVSPDVGAEPTNTSRSSCSTADTPTGSGLYRPSDTVQAPLPLETSLDDLPSLCNRYPSSLIYALKRASFRNARDVLLTPTNVINSVADLSEEQVQLFRKLRAELRVLCGMAPDGASAQYELTPLLAFAEFWNADTRFRNSVLGRARLATVGDVLSMLPEEFALVRGVGRKQLRQYEELRKLLTSCACVPLIEPGQMSTFQLPLRFNSLSDLFRQLADAISQRVSRSPGKRNWEIWLCYHGLHGERPWTLDQLGCRFGITRARVQQIVRRVWAAMQWDRPPLSLLKSGVAETFRQCLGVAIYDDFGQLLAKIMEWKEPPTSQQLRAVLPHINGESELKEDLVRCREYCSGLWKAAVREAGELLQTVGRKEHVLDFAYRLGKQLSAHCWGEGERCTDIVPCCGAKHGSVQLPIEYVRAVLASQHPCPLDGEEVWGYEWVQLRSARTRTNAAYAALQLMGHPAHYRDIASFIRQHSLWYNDISDRSVHSVLQVDKEFVNTRAPGTYGLAKWGVEPYQTSADRVEKLLRERKQPVLVREIVQALRDEGVSENNVWACLAQRRFLKQPDGRVGLRDWSDRSPTQQGISVQEEKKKGLAELFAADEDDVLLIR